MGYLDRLDLFEDDESGPVVDALPSPSKAIEPESPSEADGDLPHFED
jgi:hypothetical protein